jgi:hypothetical protein
MRGTSEGRSLTAIIRDVKPGVVDLDSLQKGSRVVDEF